MPQLAARCYTYKREEAMTNVSIHPLAIALAALPGAEPNTAILSVAGLNLRF